MTEPLQMSPERMIEALNNQVRIITAERDGLASVLQDVRDELIEERRIVRGLLDAILEHIGASIEYERFKCPLKNPDCKENCGSYGCGN